MSVLHFILDYTECPTIPANSSGICVQACNNNSECSGGQLCCSNGCGFQCMSGELRGLKISYIYSNMYNCYNSCLLQFSTTHKEHIICCLASYIAAAKNKKVKLFGVQVKECHTAKHFTVDWCLQDTMHDI